MPLIRINQDPMALTVEMKDAFKQHLRILHNTEDDLISLYLQSAIDAIATYAGNDIFLAQYEYQKMREDCLEEYCNELCETPQRWYCGKHSISAPKVEDSQGVDITANYKIDTQRGYFYPMPNFETEKVTFFAGYQTASVLPPRLTMIIFRYGASLFEMREHSKIGETKLLPDWVKYVLPSIWTPNA